MLVLPGIWVAVVLALEYILPGRIQLTPLLAAAPGIACAATGRRQCVVLAGLCALFALLPFGTGEGSGPGHDAGLGQRFATFAAILAVAGASYVISQRRIRVLRDLTQAWAVADAAQRVLLRPPSASVGDVWVAAHHLSATAGPAIGGGFHEVVDTPYGVRALVGEVHGGGLRAVECALVVLGAFREAAYDEPDVRDVVHRLDVSLRRHLLAGDRRPLPGGAPGSVTPSPLPPSPPPSGSLGAADLWQLTDVLTRPRPAVPETEHEDLVGVAVVSISPDGRLQFVNHGLPAPYLIRARTVAALEDDRAFETDFGPGDSVLLVTDGVTEARDRDGVLFPVAAVLTLLADASPDEFVARVRSAVVAHTNGVPADDLALMLLRRTEGAAVHG